MNFDTLGWSIVKGSHDGSPIVIRFRQFPVSFPRIDYPHCLNLFWSLAAPTDQGLPSTSDSESLSLFEDRLVGVVEPDNQAILSTVLTGKNQREFVFHTRDPQDFLRRLTEMPQEQERYPIQIQHSHDETWDYVDRVIRDIQQ
jgi:hypothetical protein